jgi:hypothetical protein
MSNPNVPGVTLWTAVALMATCRTAASDRSAGTPLKIGEASLAAPTNSVAVAGAVKFQIDRISAHATGKLREPSWQNQKSAIAAARNAIKIYVG